MDRMKTNKKKTQTTIKMVQINIVLCIKHGWVLFVSAKLIQSLFRAKSALKLI